MRATRRDIEEEDTTGLDGPTEFTSALNDAYSHPPQYGCRLSLHSAYSLLRDSTPFSGFWRLDHRPLEATMCGGTISTVTSCSGAGRHVLLVRLSFVYVANCSPLRQSDITFSRYECWHQTSRRSRTQRDDVSNSPPSPSTTA